MLARLLCIVLLALLPGVSLAQPNPYVARPTAIEVAAGMLPCLQETADFEVKLIGDVMMGRIYESGEESIWVTRTLPADDLSRLTDFQFWLDDDPIRPPMILHFRRSKAEYAPSAREHAIGCFREAYRPQH